MTPSAEDMAIAAKAKASFDAQDFATSAEFFRALQARVGDMIRHGNDGVIRAFENDAGGNLVITNMINGRVQTFSRDPDRVFRERP